MSIILLGLQLITIILLIIKRKKGNPIMADLSALIAQIKANTDIEESAIQCINGLAAKLDEARGNQTAIDGVIAEMRAKASALSAAIKANTDIPPQPAIEPTESKGDYQPTE